MLLIGDLEYVQGHLRCGHYECSVLKEDEEKVRNMSEKDLNEYIKENGTLLIDDYEVDDVGDIMDIEIEE